MDKQQLTALATQAKAGDSRAFEKLYLEHARSILFHVRSLIVDKENYSDVAQEVALEMYTHIGQLREPSAFRAWMHQVVRTTCADHNRSLQTAERHLSTADNEELLLQVEDESLDSDPEAVALATMEGNRLFAIVSEMPVGYREIVTQRFYDDLSYKEIAAAQGVSVSNVSTRLQRAMEMIRKKMGDRDDELGTDMKGEHKDRAAEQRLEEESKAAQPSVAQPADAEPVLTDAASDELEHKAPQDNIGLGPSLASGVAMLIPEESVKSFASFVGTKVLGVGATSVAVGAAASAGVAAKAGTVIAVLLSAATLTFAVVVGSTSLIAHNEGALSGTPSAIKQTYTLDYTGIMDIVFTDANGGATDLNVVGVQLVEHEPVAVEISWELRSVSVGDNGAVDASSAVALAAGEGLVIDSATLTSLAPGTYQAAYILVETSGASAEITRSFIVE